MIRPGVMMTLLLVGRPSVAAPAADIVRVWSAPGATIDLTPTMTRARASGAAVVDDRALPPAPSTARADLQRGRAAYAALRLDDARAAFEHALAELDRTGSPELTPSEIADALLLRGAIHALLDGEAGAWDDFVAAATVAPARQLDPAQFPPKVIERFERARGVVAQAAHAQLTIAAPRGCAITLDGMRLTGSTVEVIAGTHWLAAACPDRAGAGGRIDVAAGAVTLDAGGPASSPPTDQEVLTGARLAGARAVLIVRVGGGVATVRRLGIDGREQARGDLALGPPTVDDALAQLVGRLLRPAQSAGPSWTHARWMWAGIGALVTAAVLVPLALRDTSGSGDATVRPTGLPPW